MADQEAAYPIHIYIFEDSEVLYRDGLLICHYYIPLHFTLLGLKEVDKTVLFSLGATVSRIPSRGRDFEADMFVYRYMYTDI